MSKAKNAIKPVAKKPETVKKLWWCFTRDHMEDWFVIAGSATGARRFFSGYEGYNYSEVSAVEVATLPEKWQHLRTSHPDLNTSILSDCGGVRAIRPASPESHELAKQLGTVEEAWRFGDRVYSPSDVYEMIRKDHKAETTITLAVVLKEKGDQKKLHNYACEYGDNDGLEFMSEQILADEEDLREGESLKLYLAEVPVSALKLMPRELLKSRY